MSERPRFGLGAKLLFCAGAAANGVKSYGLTTFLLIFYNQVVGLPPATIGAAIAIILVFDAVLDPIVGLLSDNFRSRWGRRHPFMYAAAIPLAVGFFLLWNPPIGASESTLFVYMVACLIAVRLFDTFFEVPSSALVPELAKGYNERTLLISGRAAFAAAGGLGLSVLAYQVFMRENADGTGGITERAGYFSYSLTAAAIIFTAILVCAISTHRMIPYLAPPPDRRFTPMNALRQVGGIVRNRNFIIICCAGLLNAIAGGMFQSLQLYFGIYYWELSQTQLSVLAAGSVAGSFAGAALAPLVSVRLGKKRAAMVLYAAAIIINCSPIILRMIGLAPANGDPLLFPLILGAAVISLGCAFSLHILFGSMIADIVEEVELKTGRRTEGLVFSADQLFKKMVSGVGVFFAGTLLAYIQFPSNAVRSAVEADVLTNLALGFVPLYLLIGTTAILALMFFRGTRASHEANLRALAEKAPAAALDPPGAVTGEAGPVLPVGLQTGALGRTP